MDTVIELRSILLKLASIAAQGSAHDNGTVDQIYTEDGKYIGGWSLKFRCEEIDRVIKNHQAPLREKRPTYSVEELAAVPIGELYSLGFKRWSNASQLLLIPLWAWHYVKNGEPLTSIGNERVLKNPEIDLDTRSGAVAYGFHHPQLVIEPNL
jgi:hypothetical protein